jgi:flagellar basal-body rod protein FlgB
MVNGLFSSSNYQGLKKMLDGTVMRQEAIASNLANLETPNYKRIDIDPNFSSELSRAISARNNREISAMQPGLVLDKNASAPNRDGNTVQLEAELINLQQNTMAHTMQTQFLSSTIMKLKSAINGRNV